VKFRRLLIFSFLCNCLTVFSILRVPSLWEGWNGQMKILANDGISKSGIEALEKGGFEVITVKVAQNQLENYINEHNIDAILVRSATQVRQ
jgi:hypothetical protein